MAKAKKARRSATLDSKITAAQVRTRNEFMTLIGAKLN